MQEVLEQERAMGIKRDINDDDDSDDIMNNAGAESEVCALLITGYFKTGV